MGQGNLGEVQDWFWNPPEGPGRVRGPSERYGTGSRDRRGGPGRLGGPSGRSGMGRGTLGEIQEWSRTLGDVWDGLEVPLEGLGRIK